MTNGRTNLHLAVTTPANAQTGFSEPIRVVLADDHAKMRGSIRLLLDSEPGVEVVAEKADVEQVAEHTAIHQPDVLILDLHLPNTSSIGLIRRLRAESPGTKIVILTMQNSAAFARQVLRAGASAYVLKEHADADLRTAVHDAQAGEVFVSSEVAAGLEAFGNAIGVDGLTERELEVLQLTALGHTAVEIGRRMRVSTRTVESHRAHVHEKLQLGSRAELVQYALGRGLMPVHVPER